MMSNEGWWDREEGDDYMPSMSERVAHHIAVEGQYQPDTEWILSPFDTWEVNPFFTGIRTMHPDMSDAVYEEADREGWKVHPNHLWAEQFGPPVPSFLLPVFDDDKDLPF